MRGGGGGTLERGGAGGAVPRRGGRPLGPARPGDLAAGEGSRGGRGGRDDRVRGAVGREAAGAVQRRGSGRARRPATGQRGETDDPEAGAARPAAAPAGGAAGGRRAVDQSQGRGVDGGGAGGRLGGGPAGRGGAGGGRLVGPGAAAGASGAGHGGRAGGVQKKLATVLAEEAERHPGKIVEVFATDEHRIGLKPILRRVWAPKSERPRAPGPHRFEWLYVIAFVQPTSGEVFWYLANGVSKPSFEALLALFAREAGAGRDRIIILVLDSAGWHTEPGLAVPEGVRLVHLPPYSPELQPAECLWPVLDEPLANKHFATIRDLDRAVAERCVTFAAAPHLYGERVDSHWWPKPVSSAWSSGKRITRRTSRRNRQEQRRALVEAAEAERGSSLAIGRVEDLAAKVHRGLDGLDWR